MLGKDILYGLYINSNQSLVVLYRFLECCICKSDKVWFLIKSRIMHISNWQDAFNFLHTIMEKYEANQQRSLKKNRT
jgi:hypothetical protein